MRSFFTYITQRQTITYDGFGNKTRVDYSIGPQTVIGGDIPTDGSYTVTSSRVYSGPHIFTDGELEYSGFAGGYFGADSSPNYYINDRQGNVVRVLNNHGKSIQSTDYYPYGEPKTEPSGQRFLFGGKEREHAAGRNTYDFGARCLSPIGRWTVVDKKAFKYYSLSPYVYCAGDPINFIDPDGKEVVSLSNEENSMRAAASYTDNGNIIVFTHGNTGQMEYNLRSENLGINTPTDFVLALLTEFESIDQYNFFEEPLIIELHCCNTGRIDDKCSNPIAKQISSEIRNAIVMAPNGYLFYNFDTNSENVYYNNKSIGTDENPKYKGENPATPAWRFFFRGEEISILLIPFCRILVSLEQYLEIEAEGKIIQSH